MTKWIKKIWNEYHTAYYHQKLIVWVVWDFFIVWLLWNFTGARLIFRKIHPYKNGYTPKRPPSSFFLWIISIYFAFYGFASTRYENREDFLETKVNSIITQAALNPKNARKALERIPATQKITLPLKPEFKRPRSVFNSILYEETNQSAITTLQGVIASYAIEENKEIFDGINLQGADLGKADLRGADLRGANLREAYLIGADLRGGDLREANLRGANLRWVILLDADLSKADLRWAKLREAKLIGAKLIGTDLSKTDLSKANLRGAKYNRLTNFLKGFNPKERGMTGVEIEAYPSEALLKEALLREAKKNKLIDFPKNFNPKDHGMVEIE